ncbi:hypothetical protein CMV_019173 [Castanea mollissima]|uniref:Uncharacterized protein n=1 Tax=Castanea mollissima TaxID=60419 RepID=A0A8J4QZA3_9ROSI|nr:hypothetical protein CMV_019173 [Castanea mollissima]
MLPPESKLVAKLLLLLKTRSNVKVIKRYSLQLKRDAANTWEVDTAFKPLDVLFSSFLGSIAHDMIIYWRFHLGSIVVFEELFYS